MNYINIASIPERLDCLTDTIESIYDQADEINLYLNNYKDLPFKDKKINQVIGDNSKGDAGKAFFAERVSGWYFMLDDDLILPNDYVSNTLKNMYKREIVTYHGRTINKKGEIRSYYKAPADRYRCLGRVVKDVDHVQIAGTGVTCFHTNDLKVRWEDIKHKNMFDLVFSAMARKQKKKITVLKHSETWIKYNMKMMNKSTIYDDYCNNDIEQTQFYNENF